MVYISDSQSGQIHHLGGGFDGQGSEQTKGRGTKQQKGW